MTTDTADPRIAQLNYLIGMDYADAKREATQAGYIFREVTRDGSILNVTQDKINNRVNVTTEGGKVTGIRNFG
jgi:hypothetical protein